MKGKKIASPKKASAPVNTNDQTKRGYNEKNPTQPQGAFKPDSANKKSKSDS